MSGFAIDAMEWRALFLENLQRMASFVNDRRVISADEMKMLHLHQERGKTIVAAWCAAGQRSAMPADPVSDTSDVQVTESPPPAAKPILARRKGGWPKGKPRTRQKRYEAH